MPSTVWLNHKQQCGSGRVKNKKAPDSGAFRFGRCQYPLSADIVDLVADFPLVVPICDRVGRGWGRWRRMRSRLMPSGLCESGHWSELGELSEVLGGGGEQELVAGAAWSAQPQATEPEDALEVGEQHLDLLAPVP